MVDADNFEVDLEKATFYDDEHDSKIAVFTHVSSVRMVKVKTPGELVVIDSRGKAAASPETTDIPADPA